MRPRPPSTGPTTDRAGQYAAESLKAAQDARAALDAELKAQEGKWFKSYDKTKELAVAAKAAGDKAAADAVAGKEKADAVAAKAKADAAARAKAKVAPVRVGGRIKPPNKIKDVKPVYPAIAQSARVAGAVTIEATIGADGKVIDAKVVRSIPLLDQAALDAVRQWEYTADPPERRARAGSRDGHDQLHADSTDFSWLLLIHNLVGQLEPEPRGAATISSRCDAVRGA